VLEVLRGRKVTVVLTLLRGFLVMLPIALLEKPSGPN
jgi:hypothetical protein